MSEIINRLNIIMSDTYALYLKTQNYHWHVKGPQFKSLHELFEAQYNELAAAIDLIAERILTLGHHAPATFTAFEKLKTIQDGRSDLDANSMVIELAHDHGKLLKDLGAAIISAQKINDEGSANMLANLIETHEKIRWMLESSAEQN